MIRIINQFTFTLVLIINWSFSYSQSTGDATSFAGPVVTAEFYGVGLGLTVNVEHLIMKRSKMFVSGRLGYGEHNSFSSGDYTFKSIPISVSAFSGIGKHHKEVGLGLTYAEGNQDAGVFERPNKSLFVVPFIGYRYQRSNGGFFCKIQYSPFIKMKEYTDERVYKSMVGDFVHNAGITVGYYFSRKK
jgi:hypothetical protein